MGDWRVDGRKVRAARHRAALSLEELAKLAGVGHITIHRIETGKVKSDPYPSTVRKIAAALKVEPVDLMTEEDAAGK
jgi:transcriptional regulator with XRE-family HTH domain